MRIEQIYTGCLAQGAYYIESNGEVAIIDPLRETQQYVDKANKEDAKIKYIFETHFHADFVGAGSACGKNLSKETIGILGEQKKTNYALRADMTKTEFVKEVLDGIAPPPQYFAKNAMMNKSGYDAFDSVLKKGDTPLNPETFEHIANQENALVLDVRTQKDFVKGHIPNSIFIGINGGFAPWVGALLLNIWLVST